MVSIADLSCLFEGGLRRNIPTKEVTESDMQKQIAKFLRGSSDRQGGRQRRKDVVTARKAAKAARRNAATEKAQHRKSPAATTFAPRSPSSAHDSSSGN